MSHEGVSKASPGHHQGLYCHESNIRAMHQGGKAAGNKSDDAVMGLGPQTGGRGQ